MFSKGFSLSCTVDISVGMVNHMFTFMHERVFMYTLRKSAQSVRGVLRIGTVQRSGHPRPGFGYGVAPGAWPNAAVWLLSEQHKPLCGLPCIPASGMFCGGTAG